MAVKDAKLLPAIPDTNAIVNEGAGAMKPVHAHLAAVAINQAGVTYARIRVPFKFEVVSVSAWSRALAAAASIDVKVLAVSVLTGALVPAVGAGNAPARGAMVAARATRRGNAGDYIDVVVTTDGTGTLTDCDVTVWLRPYPLSGEA